MMKKKFSLSVLCATLLLFTYSCIEGFKDDASYDAGVYNTTLESPDVTRFTMRKSTDKTSATISWPVVLGAEGYEYSVTSSVDQVNYSPLVNTTTTDRLSFVMPLEADTYYRIYVRALGDQKKNNSDSPEPSLYTFTTFLPVLETIPSGDLNKWFEERAKEKGALGATFEHTDGGTYDQYWFPLTPGGTYTISEELDFGDASVILEGDEENPATFTVSGGFKNNGTGLELYNAEFKFSSSYRSTAFLQSYYDSGSKDDWYVVSNDVIFQNCKMLGLPGQLLHDGNNKTAYPVVWIENCVINISDESSRLIRIEKGIIRDLIMENSTFYYDERGTTYFIQYNSSRIENVKAENVVDWSNETGGLTINNCTFYQCAGYGTTQFANYAGLSRPGNYLICTKNIFVDCSNELIRRLRGNANNLVPTLGYNTYWRDGAFNEVELSSSYPDQSGTALRGNPDFVDPDNGNFTVQGSDQIQNRTGDPRWLPKQ